MRRAQTKAGAERIKRALSALQNININPKTGGDYFDNFEVSEWDMYGSSRLGVKKPITGEASQQRSFSAGFSGVYFHSVSYGMASPLLSCTDGCLLTRVLGKKEFEFTNHLGNVLETVNDIHLPVGTSSSHTVDYYTSDVIAYSDYFVFGSTQSNRSGGDYRYGFNGTEHEPEIANDVYSTYYRFEDSRLGRWFSLDPEERASVNPHCSMDNSPIFFNDVMGDHLGFDIFEGSDEEQQATYTSLWRNLNEMFNGKVEISDQSDVEDGIILTSLKVKDGKELTKGEQIKFNYINSLIWSSTNYWVGLTNSTSSYVMHGDVNGKPMTTEPFAYDMWSGVGTHGGHYDLVINSNCLNRGTNLVSSSDFLFLALTGLENCNQVNTYLFNAATGLNVVYAGFRTTTRLSLQTGEKIPYHSFEMIIKAPLQGSTPLINKKAEYYDYWIGGGYPDYITPGKNDSNYKIGTRETKAKWRRLKKYRKQYGR